MLYIDNMKDVYIINTDRDEPSVDACATVPSTVVQLPNEEQQSEGVTDCGSAWMRKVAWARWSGVARILESGEFVYFVGGPRIQVCVFCWRFPDSSLCILLEVPGFKNSGYVTVDVHFQSPFVTFVTFRHLFVTPSNPYWIRRTANCVTK